MRTLLQMWGVFAPCCLTIHLLESAGSLSNLSRKAHDIIYEAEDQKTSGLQIGPGRQVGSLVGEASGRRAVWLGPGRSIDIRLREPAQGITIRYALPFAAKLCRRASALIDLDGHLAATVTLDARYVTPYTRHQVDLSKPGEFAPRFWDEVRVLLHKPAAAGTKLSLRADLSTKGFALDFVETESVQVPTRYPRNAMSVLSFGADPTGHRSSLTSFERAIAEASKRRQILYIPSGRYRISGHLIVDRVRIVGAGPWHSAIFGHSLGFYSRREGSAGVLLSGFAVESDVRLRNDRLQRAAIGGRFSWSTFRNLYVHHANVGLWLDGPAHDLLLKDLQISDVAADGINLHRGISRALVENNRIRNSGDDGIASWSEEIPNSDVAIRQNRVTSPRLANGIALYGGRNIEVSRNWIADTLTEGGGIHLGARFHSAPFGGWIRISNNEIVRSGSMDPHWHFGIGAIWIYALERPISASISILNNGISDPGCEAVQLIGPEKIGGVTIDGLHIRGSTAPVFAIQTSGSMRAARVVVGDAPLKPIVEVGTGLHFTIGPGNRGWNTKAVANETPHCN